jgi:precorrin-4/cobalt-precorrin-4 C11-methyltransferase
VISFVGAGPGAPDLMTLRAAQRLAAADVVVWAASLVPEAVLDGCREGVELHDSKSMTLQQVCDVFANHTDDTAIVRLHSGDPTVYSAVAEQVAWCRANDRAFEIVPGVSSMSATAAAAGCELTVPGVSQSVVLTRLAGGTQRSVPEREAIGLFAAAGSTMAVFLSVAHVERLAAQLLADGSGYDVDTPVVIGHRVSQPDEQVMASTVGRMSGDVREAGLETTTLFLIGPALGGAGELCSHVYSPDYTTRFRTATGGAV